MTTTALFEDEPTMEEVAEMPETTQDEKEVKQAAILRAFIVTILKHIRTTSTRTLNKTEEEDSVISLFKRLFEDIRKETLSEHMEICARLSYQMITIFE